MNITVRMGRTHLRLLALTAILLLAGVHSASAHARLIKSLPDNNAQLQVAPHQVELWFNELLDDGFNSIEVFPAEQLNDPKHDHLTKGIPLVDPKDRTHLTIPVTTLKPGNYVISYRVLSRDGHTSPGRIMFHLAPPEPKQETK